MRTEGAVAFVTGATGFVGRALVPRLVEAGYRVHALARPSADRGPLRHVPVHWHTGDLSEPDGVLDALRDAARAGPPAVAIHGGAVISYARGAGALQERVNVDATAALLEAARAVGFERRVHVGSVVAVGVAPDARVVLDEEAPWDPRLEHVDYVRTKRRADERALQLGATVVDPGAIFGPGSVASNTTRFVDRLRRSGAPILVPPGGLAVVDVDDVALGILAAAERGAPSRRYLLVESNWSLRALFALGATLAGRRRPLGSVPRPVWMGVVALAGLADRVRPLELLAPQGLRLLAEHYRFDGARARSELGWAPRPFRETLERTLRWLQEREPRAGP